MRHNPEYLVFDRTDPKLIQIRTEDEGELVCSFSANAEWQDHHIRVALKMAYQSYRQGLKDGAENGKAEIRHALGCNCQ